MKVSKDTVIGISILVSVLALLLSAWALSIALKTDADISEIKSLASDIKNDTTEIKEILSGGVSGCWFLIIIVIVMVISIGFVAYLFYPEKKKQQRKKSKD